MGGFSAPARQPNWGTIPKSSGFTWASRSVLRDRILRYRSSSQGASRRRLRREYGWSISKNRFEPEGGAEANSDARPGSDGQRARAQQARVARDDQSGDDLQSGFGGS